MVYYLIWFIDLFLKKNENWTSFQQIGNGELSRAELLLMGTKQSAEVKKFIPIISSKKKNNSSSFQISI